MASLLLGDLMPAILLENVTASYGDSVAIENISCEFKQGESWAICGPNGAGKSTLIKVVLGLVKNSSGKVELSQLKPSEISYLPQVSHLDREAPITVFELAAMGLRYEIGHFGGLSSTQKMRVVESLKKVEMDTFSKAMISDLSSGQFKRVLFARMLVQQAKFLILDEPFNSLDESTTEALLKLLENMREEGLSVMAVLHDLGHVRNHFDHTLLLAKKLIAKGKTHDVLVKENLAITRNFKESWLEELL